MGAAGNVKKRAIVMARTPGIQETGIETSKGNLSFKNQGQMWIKDPGLANEIAQRYPGQVNVTTDQQYEYHLKHDGANGTRTDNIHTYTFNGVDIPKDQKDGYDPWVETSPGRFAYRPKKERKDADSISNQ